jgi:hypothetical protein
MITILLQIWGGTFYLLNKLFFSRAERAATLEQRRAWQIRAWTVYLIGLPPWVFIFITEHNWIAAAVESSGVPAMLIGLSAARQGHTQFRQYVWLDRLARLMIITGLGLSLYDFGGLTTLNQVIELGVAAGFLLGTYLLAKSKPSGYFWLMLGNVSAASLMMRQGYYLLMAQQLLSLILVIDAYRVQRRRLEVKVDNEFSDL